MGHERVAAREEDKALRGRIAALGVTEQQVRAEADLPENAEVVERGFTNSNSAKASIRRFFRDGGGLNSRSRATIAALVDKALARTLAAGIAEQEPPTPSNGGLVERAAGDTLVDLAELLADGVAGSLKVGAVNVTIRLWPA